jgi:hypothetical protein
VSWQMDSTSLTQIESQRTLQQYESLAQISVAQVSHPDVSLRPVSQTSCLHEPIGTPPPLLLLLDELLDDDDDELLDEPLLLPLELDPEEELLDDELLELDDELLPLELPLPLVQSATSGVPQPVGPS